MAFLHQCLEGGQIGLPEVAVGGLDIHRVAQGFGSAMHGIVLGAGMSLQVVVVVALHAEHGLHTEYGIQIGILATGLLSASPAGVTEDVDIRAPERQLGVAGIVGLAHSHMLHTVVGAVPVGAGLVADLREHIVDEFLAEGSSHADGLRIDGVVTLTHTMTGFAPPVVGGDAQPLDGDALVHHQSHLLLGSEQGDEVFHAFLGRQRRVLERILHLGLSRRCSQECGYCRENDSLHIMILFILYCH